MRITLLPTPEKAVGGRRQVRLYEDPTYELEIVKSSL